MIAIKTNKTCFHHFWNWTFYILKTNNIIFIWNNSHKFVCEVSQNVMYQYILLVIWLFMVAGMCISAASFIHLLSQYLRAVFWMHNPSNCRESMSGKIHSLLTLREIEYLEMIKTINLSLYGEILRELTKARPDLFALTKYFNNESSYLARHVWL